jgi:hypothetical protein
MRIMDVLRKRIRSFPKRLRDHALGTGSHAVKKGRHGLLSNHTRDASLTAPPLCAFDGRRAKRHGWRRLQGDMHTLVPVVASLAHRGKAHRKGGKNEHPVIRGKTCCMDRQEAKRLAQSTPPSCAAAAQ